MEETRIYRTMSIVGGMMGVYTLQLRGGVACNGGTGNFYHAAAFAGSGDLLGALYYAVPIGVYFLGVMLSEYLPEKLERLGGLHWNTLLTGFETAALLLMGFLPLSVPNHLIQIVMSFLCSMQYNSFRKADGIPMATTFCTNHLRQTAVHLVKYWETGDGEALRRIKAHGSMMGCFLLGGVAEVAACIRLSQRAIWLAAIPLSIVFFYLLYSDKKAYGFVAN